LSEDLMPTPAPDVTEAELAVLKRLWETPGATIRELTTALYPAGSAACYATVQKLLERLEAKGCVRRDATETSHRFHPAVDRDTLLAGRLKAVADKFCEGSLTPLLTHLVQSRQLSRHDIDQLRALIDTQGNLPSTRRRR